MLASCSLHEKEELAEARDVQWDYKSLIRRKGRLERLSGGKSALEGNTRRAIDIHEGEKLNATAFKALIKAAVAENLRVSAPKSKSTPKRTRK